VTTSTSKLVSCSINGNCSLYNMPWQSHFHPVLRTTSSFSVYTYVIFEFIRRKTQLSQAPFRSRFWSWKGEPRFTFGTSTQADTQRSNQLESLVNYCKVQEEDSYNCWVVLEIGANCGAVDLAFYSGSWESLGGRTQL
jgi:hypothetical protein